MVMSASEAPVFVDQVSHLFCLFNKMLHLEIIGQATTSATKDLILDFFCQIFSIFDQDGNGSIDLKEFMLATETSERGSIEEKVTSTKKIVVFVETDIAADS